MAKKSVLRSTTFSLSGKFDSTVKLYLPATAYANGSFDGTYVAKGLSATRENSKVIFDSWNIYLRDSNGNILNTLSSSIQGNFASIDVLSSALLLRLGNSNQQLCLFFKHGFNGVGDISSRLVSTYIDDYSTHPSTRIDVMSATSSVATSPSFLANLFV
jgi:hypothetical protein